ncbi:MAG: YceI family protein [Sandaracinaceae bacterium]|nr:YceI family protein [Sandaracinaceae bacterium]
MRATLLIALAVPLLAVGCDDPADSVPAARMETTPATPPEPAADEAAPEDDGTPMPPGALVMNTATSTLEMIGSKVTGSETLHLGEWSGYVDLREPFEQSVVRVDMQMTTIEAPIPRLTNHLRTDDFFDVERFPTARFETTAFAAAPEGSENATHLVTGHLTIRGVTQTITFPVRVDVSDSEVHAQAQFAIDRQRWGISYRGMEDDLINDQVVIRFDVHAPRDSG